ncbi:MAG: putative glycosyltransferase [Mucilaginibacter sp.]|nr:putative glycosyltransferase [Mucilaginibacter sp.]
MLISVIMSVYNAQEYLNDAVESILNQSYTNFEFIIIDDGSVDDSAKIIEGYAAKDNRIVFVKNFINIGLPQSLNKGIEIAKGEYIARQDADDTSSAIRLERQARYAAANPDVDLIGSDCYIIDLDGQRICEIDTYSKNIDHKRKLLNKTSIFPHGSAFIKREKLIEVGLYDPRFYFSQDGELWLRLLSKGAKIHVMDEPLYYYRMMPFKNTRKLNAQREYNEVKKMIYDYGYDSEKVQEELVKIRLKVSDSSCFSAIPNYMAKYWKGLANTIYFNKKVKNASPYKYLLKAWKTTESFNDYFQYIKLAIVYALPSQFVKKYFL